MSGPWHVGCGSADVTGELWDAGMLGYGMRWQRTQGLHLRQRSRAFAVADPSTGRRLVLVVADLGMFFANVREAVLARLDLRPEELLLTATHTHAGPGGFSGYRMYGTTNGGIRPHTLAAVVDGVVLSVQRALADLAPGTARAHPGRAARRERQPLAGRLRAQPLGRPRPLPGRHRPWCDRPAARAGRRCGRRRALVRHPRHEPVQPQPARQRGQQGLGGLGVGVRRPRRRRGLRADQLR